MASSTCSGRQQPWQRKGKFAGKKEKNANSSKAEKQQKSKLFEDNEEADDLTLQVNSRYAKKYGHWKKQEERQKLLDRYGKDGDELGSSSSEDEDENGDRLPPDFDKNFLHTLACLRKKDSSIYKKDHRFFSDEVITLQSKPEQKKRSEKPMYLHDYQREMLLSHDGKPIDEGEGSKKKKGPATYVEEQKELKNSFKNALDDSDDEGALFTGFKRASNPESIKNKQGLLDDENKNEINKVWSDEIDESEAFLRDFFLQQKHIDEDNKKRVPTYDEIVASEESEEESFTEQQEDFENKYDFRFEEPDQEFIKKYPRTVLQSYRIKDAKRSEKRSEVKQKKQQLKAKKLNELKRLKALKRAEIMEKLEKIKKITGNTKVGFGDDDLNEDFSPEQHDKRMQQIFDDEYYEEEEAEEPELPFEEEELQVDNWDEWKGDDGKDTKPHCEDPDFVMDCDYDPSAKQLENEKSGKKKRRGNFRSALRKKKPVFDPENKTFEDYFDEYYKLDYEDIIGDLPCRFQYRNVAPNDFGLSLDEVLAADDKELNKWCSLKKACQYRSQEEETYDVMAYKKHGSNLKRKMKILKSVYQTEEDDETEAPQEMQVAETASDGHTSSKNGSIKSPKSNKKSGKQTSKNNKKRKMSFKEDSGSSPKKAKNETQAEIPDARLKAYGINPKKFKNKLKYGKSKQTAE